MVLSVPKLDVFFIDFEIPTEQPKSKIPMFIKTTAWMVGGPHAYLTTVAGLKALGADGVSLRRLIDEKRFNIIRTKEELAEYENANGNEWIINEKKLKQKQYYIRHPKKLNRNILIEAKSFYNYIEEEQKDELVDFILSHCPVKMIQINRTEISETSGNTKIMAKGADLSGSINTNYMDGNYYSCNLPNGTPKIMPRDEYLWIDKSIMRSISALTEGASLTQTYESDFTFGLSLNEAKTIGLDLNKRKKYNYVIHIEC